MTNSWLAQCLAHFVLEVSPDFGICYTHVDDRETKDVTVGGSAIACQCTDTRHGARFGANVAVGRTTAHAFPKSAVNTGYGHG